MENLFKENQWQPSKQIQRKALTIIEKIPKFIKQIWKYLTAGYNQRNRQQAVRLSRNDTVPTIGTYIYINNLFVPSLLKLVLFGNNYNYINTAIFESAAKLVVHLPLVVQLNELLTVQGLSATNFLAGNCSQY